MIDLGSTEFLLAVPSIPPSELELQSTALFDSWESFVDASLQLPDYSLFLQVEEGSISGRAKIAAGLWAVYMTIGQYGDFISGLGTVRRQASAVGNYVAETAGRTFSCSDSSATIKKRGGSLAALQRLFVKVQKGELTPDGAMRQAVHLLGDESRNEPRFMRDLEESLRNCRRFPEQQPLPFVEPADEVIEVIHQSPEPPRQPRPKPDAGPPLHWRIEVWRESKTKRKQKKITQL